MASASLLFFFLHLLPWQFLAQNTGELKVGETLTAGDNAEALVSPFGDFAFGFHKLESNDLYLLAIWFNKIPDKTIVWFSKPNGDNPAPRNSKLQLSANRGLVLTNPQGNLIWESGLSSGEAASAFMNSTGNFMIRNGEGEVLWQSFDDHRDTLLPGQRLEKGGRILNSRLRENNFSLGRFQFRLIGDGNGVLNFNNLPTGFAYDAYYWTNTVDSNASNAGLRIEFNESAYLYVLRANNARVIITPTALVPVPSSEYYHRVTLHFDGVLAQYYYPKNSNSDGKWSVVFTEPDNICTSTSGAGAGPCGFNGICQLSEADRAMCSCPQNFSLLDPNDVYGGCRPDFYTQFCEEDSPNSPQDFKFIELAKIDWPTSDYEMYKPYDLESCQKSCTLDCFCNVIVFREQTCWKKKLPLSNGRRDRGVNGKTFIKVGNGNYSGRGFPPSCEKNKQSGFDLLVSLFLSGSVFVNFMVVALAGFLLLLLNRKATRIVQTDRFNLRYFTYKELMEATNEFKEELGRGSFGIVYKGVVKLSNNIAVAVKKLDRIVADGEKEFRTEVEVIGQTHHKNLVKIVAFCDEGQHRLLVYEFVKNGTLSSFLFGYTKPSWEQRTRIAFGVARGLVYLHEECDTQIIHCDIKPQNILLDGNFDAKIADFGLAKLLSIDQSQTLTAIRGTKGYVAPEWFRNVPVTAKVDVYSFGVVLLEIVCCRKNVSIEMSGAEAILTDWAYDCFVEGNIAALIENDEEALVDMSKVKRFVMVAIWCVQEDPNLRPTMKRVTSMLEGIVEVRVPSCPTPFSAV